MIQPADPEPRDPARPDIGIVGVQFHCATMMMFGRIEVAHHHLPRPHNAVSLGVVLVKLQGFGYVPEALMPTPAATLAST